MAFQLFNKAKPAFGLDISDTSFKIVQLEQKGKGAIVRGYTEMPMPKGVLNADQIVDRTTFNHLMKATLERPQYGRLDSKYAVVNVPETKSFVRVIQIPHMSEAEAESAVPFEAESFIPLPIDQVYLDWQYLTPAGDKMNVLIIASPKDYVDAYLDILEASGIQPVALEVESQSCHRAFINPELKETCLIVDMASSRTSLIMVEEGNLQFTSTIPIAGNNFTESIARNLGISSAKAEIIKMKVGITNTAEYPNIKTALLPVLSNLTAEIKNILRFHSEHSDKAVNKIVLAGGTAKLANFTQYMAGEFSDTPGMSVVLGNPWATIPHLQTPPLSPEDALNYTTAIGLAIRGIHWQN